MKNLLFVIFFLFMSKCSIAGVNLSKTRVVLDSESGYTGSVRVNNHGNEEVLIQTWVDDGHNKVNPKSILVTPPIRRLQGGKSALVKIKLAGPKDTLNFTSVEQVYYLNIKAIPKRSHIDNRLLISTNSRIKLFIRPTSLDSQESLYSDSSKLNVNFENGVYTIENNSNFSANFEEVEIGGASYSGNILLPGDSLELNHDSFVNVIDMIIINDYGAKKDLKLPVNKD